MELIQYQGYPDYSHQCAWKWRLKVETYFTFFLSCVEACNDAALPLKSLSQLSSPAATTTSRKIQIATWFLVSVSSFTPATHFISHHSIIKPFKQRNVQRTYNQQQMCEIFPTLVPIHFWHICSFNNQWQE